MSESTGVLSIGKAVPKFKLRASGGGEVDSEQLKGKTVVLFFYPKADTPGCTKEACGFSDAITSYKDLGVPVYGISPDPIEDVQKFSDKFKLRFPLLADEDHSIAEKFGVWIEKNNYGKKYWGVGRTTFVLKDGKVARVFEKVKAEGHDVEVLKHLKG